ncbi:flagellar export chaperone FliS [Evansella halocellulosilytica]|uniref:flagellar export chaperone FliS n=1 Tax=Evansella halocellulosilytica TaxID=2011013 RepID=UPI000BB9681B|nr:flagellar export chaperone FliS [Evansella halocellulosilytica]
MKGLITKEALHKKTPQEITALLYEACLDRLEDAKDEINNKDYVQANINLQKVNDLLERLGAGLNYEAGIIADQFDAIYNYLADKVIEANVMKDTKKIDEVVALLESLASSWQEAMKADVSIQKHLAHKQKTSAYEKNIMSE